MNPKIIGNMSGHMGFTSPGPYPWSLVDERVISEDFIERVIASANVGDGMLSREELGNFPYCGGRLRVIEVQGGIWNPGVSWPLSNPLRA